MAKTPDNKAATMKMAIGIINFLRYYGLCIAIALTLSGCGGDSEEPSAADKTLDELQAKYDALRQKEFDDPVQWAADDLENIGDWEYKVELLSHSDPGDLETALNKLGDDRWEVMWMERNNDGHMVLLKRPSVSYLSKIPLSSIGRFIIDDSGTE